MRASSKARGEANAISCVRSYSTMSFHHSSAVSFFFMSRFAAGTSGSGLAVAVGFALLAILEVIPGERQPPFEGERKLVLNRPEFFKGADAAGFQLRFHTNIVLFRSPFCKRWLARVAQFLTAVRHHFILNEMVTPRAAGKAKTKNWSGRAPRRFGEEHHAKFALRFAPDALAQVGQAGDGEARAPVVTPAFGGQTGKLQRVAEVRGACRIRQRTSTSEHRQVPISPEHELDLANLTVHINLKARVHCRCSIAEFHHAEKAWLRKQRGIGRFKASGANSPQMNDRFNEQEIKSKEAKL